MKDFVKDLRSRVNPIYADQPGTESFERKLCADAIERLDMELTAATLRIENDAMVIASLKASNESYITLANTAYEITEQKTAEIAGLTREQVGLKLDAARWRKLRDLECAMCPPDRLSYYIENYDKLDVLIRTHDAAVKESTT